jgi:tRNA A-37 threonylcarbamoyl transferase component Bud32
MKPDPELPSLEGASEWLNRVATTDTKTDQSTNTETRGHPKTETKAYPGSSELKGHPTLVHFWSLNSEISKANLRHIGELRDQRKREGLRVIAVHVARPEEKISAEAVRDSLAHLNITEPCAVDRKLSLRAAFSNNFGNTQGNHHNDEDVPAYYLFDHEGKLHSSSKGEEGTLVLEQQLDQMLAELRKQYPFCPECELFLNEEAMFCAGCGLPLTLPGARGAHPYYESHHYASLPTVRLFDPDPLIGQVMQSKYELTARLGEGAMSVVYRARRLHIGDEVAVKILLRKFVTDDSVLARFRREARATALSRHANVITIHDFGENEVGDAAAFLVMEFVKGTPLRDLLKSVGQFPTERALRLMRGICAGVGAVHRQGVVHRDLKPENIIVVAPDGDYEFETVRVVDFGFAKLPNDRPAALGMVIGTPYYMSPEQCLGEPLDTRSDVYSLGVMFYEMLAGRRPFISETVSGIITKQLSDPPPPLPKSVVPGRVAAGIMSALSKDPNDRPQTATELTRQLQFV